MGYDKARIYNFDGCMSGELLEFADCTIGAASDPETSYVGVVLDCSVINTNLNKPIPVSSGYEGRIVNTLGATD